MKGKNRCKQVSYKVLRVF